MHDLKLTAEEEKLRDGVFNLNTRRFGKAAEYMIANLFDYSFPNVSPFQHRGNSKAEGHMHLNSDNIQWHIKESGFFLGWLSYKELFKLLSPKQ